MVIAGIDLIVVDDGWFGDRNNDKTSLGRYTAILLILLLYI